MASTFSCATPGVKKQDDENIFRFVRDNVFYSTSRPSVEIEVNHEFEYVGEAKNTRYVQYKGGEGKGDTNDDSWIDDEEEEEDNDNNEEDDYEEENKRDDKNWW